MRIEQSGEVSYQPPARAAEEQGKSAAGNTMSMYSVTMLASVTATAHVAASTAMPTEIWEHPADEGFRKLVRAARESPPPPGSKLRNCIYSDTHTVILQDVAQHRSGLLLSASAKPTVMPRKSTSSIVVCHTSCM